MPVSYSIALCTCLAVCCLLCFINVVSRPTPDGYVQMSSAGSVHPSKSVGDIASTGEEDEQDTGIYVEPDRTGAALLIQAE